VLKSICIKTNNIKIINYLLDKLDYISIEHLYVSKLNFKNYQNIILHYKGNDINVFLNSISNLLSSCIIQFYENSLIKHILSNNYFYFTQIEQTQILKLCTETLNTTDMHEVLLRKDSINKSLFEYFTYNKSLFLNGFIDFRLQNYLNLLDLIVDSSVNKFIIDREYIEFINLLRAYINSKNHGLNIVHLVYSNNKSILLDEFKDIIKLEHNILDTKYISDITFSSNDYSLNALLTLLPKQIYIHLINCNEDEFITTLKLIFNDRIFICKDCDICRLYSLEQISKE